MIDIRILEELVKDSLLNRFEIIALKDIITLLSVITVNNAKFRNPSMARSAILTSFNVKITPSL